MLIDSVRVYDFRSIADSGDLELGPVTVIIGPNNAGKSALLRALLMGHGAGSWEQGNIRHGHTVATAVMALTGPHLPAAIQAGGPQLADVGPVRLQFEGTDSVRKRARWATDGDPNGAATDINIAWQRPDHLFVPILTRRRAGMFETVIDDAAAAAVGMDDRTLASRLATLSYEHAEGRRYRRLMRSILDLDVSTIVVKGGALPGVPLDTRSGIALERMGDGVRNVVLFASELADDSQPRMFLIEEPENDLHPEALRRLLEEIREASQTHQFLITTHSDKVLTHLGSLPQAKVYQATNTDQDGLPTSTFTLLEDEFDRRHALTQLGYEHTLPIGWLVLEESTAQTFIEQCLIPMFTPKLASVRVVSAGGAGNVPRTVAALHRMVLFAHLAEPISPRAWVLVDGDDAGQKATATLRTNFKTWPPERFHTLARPRLEDYYPDHFRDRVDAIGRDNIQGPEAMKYKGALVKDVVRWANTEPTARAQIELSAADIISQLRRIELGIVELQQVPGQ